MMEWIIGLKSGGDFLLEIRELTVTAIVVRLLVAVILGGWLSTGKPGVRGVRGAQANPCSVRESAYDAC